MTKYDPHALNRLEMCADWIAEAFEDASDEELIEAIAARGDNPETYANSIRAVIDEALAAAVRVRFADIRERLRSLEISQRPNLAHLTRDELVEQLRTFTANDADSGELLTMAARSGKSGIAIEDLRSVVEDYLVLRSQRVKSDE